MGACQIKCYTCVLKIEFDPFIEDLLSRKTDVFCR